MVFIGAEMVTTRVANGAGNFLRGGLADAPSVKIGAKIVAGKVSEAVEGEAGSDVKTVAGDAPEAVDGGTGAEEPSIISSGAAPPVARGSCP